MAPRALVLNPALPSSKPPGEPATAVAFPFGLMFHHFAESDQEPGQGAITAQQFREMLEHVGLTRILPARAWLDRAQRGTLLARDVCLTFDDNLKCQFEVALPVLRELKLTAFWFVATGTLEGQLNRLEIYREFRTRCFAHVDEFYEAFFRCVSLSSWAEPVEQAVARLDASAYLADFPFYTEADRRFRFVRDEALGPESYQRIMDEMIAAHGQTLEVLSKNLWMQREDLRCLHAEGHVIGLHSHTHPTRLAELPEARQYEEYSRNRAVLTELIGAAPTVVSHPCNSYSQATLAILSKLGVRVGFRANMSGLTRSGLEYPRQDHANLLTALES